MSTHATLYDIHRPRRQAKRPPMARQQRAGAGMPRWLMRKPTADRLPPLARGFSRN